MIQDLDTTKSRISIHPPRVGWDFDFFNTPAVLFQFQSTHPVWGGTPVDKLRDKLIKISIHPPRVGWDSQLRHTKILDCYFNPPTPCGVGRTFRPTLRPTNQFQSTHPVWGGTALPEESA